ncbi:hypothetical protein Rsub_03899 [Raphidocelis subcapitata]|uniref:Mannose-P-dolichol utilization defect 1 protein homolog n=1 Tax=Raphidocelis subcapitata TaxID=307507 RepID=A0A2V0NZN1_9CHLO|nr:hypothetical protein Rsub_03899 [Raphidocelis subcapitata]|eukprot:GBF91043.1 hypothetical protein Rsub_03899 [Raphidocelis subcapitata]
MDTTTLLKLSFAALKSGAMPPPKVLKPLISKMMGYGIIAGSTLVKVPQIANVVRARSAEGLSAASFELESWGLLVHAAYGWVNGLPFSSYGEAGILLAQNLLLLALLYRFSRAPAGRVAAVAALLMGALFAVASGRLNRASVGALYDVNNFVMLAARVPQIAKNFTSKSTGQLSIVTFGVNTAGCVARLFTTAQDGGGPAMMRSYALSLLMNATLVAQILIYGNKGAVKAPATKGGRTKKLA